MRACSNSEFVKYNLSRYELAKRTGIQYQIIDNYYKNKVKRYDGFVLERICSALNCDLNDIIEYEKRINTLIRGRKRVLVLLKISKNIFIQLWNQYPFPIYPCLFLWHQHKS